MTGNCSFSSTPIVIYGEVHKKREAGVGKEKTGVED